MRRLHLQRRPRGFAILLVVVFTSISLLVLTSVLNWTASSANLTDRGNRFLRVTSAAEAALEKATAAISRDFQAGSVAAVDANLATYRDLIPTPAEDPAWADYEFQGGSGPISVTRLTPWSYGDLNIRYRGLRGYNSTYRLVARASQTHNASVVRGSLRRDLLLASIPVFSFGIFYASDLEICPGASTTISGFVHSNGTNYFQPDSGLTFAGTVTSSRAILHLPHPEDPVFRTPGVISYSADRESGVVSLNFPTGTNNSPAVLREIVEMPPTFETVGSPLGSLRYYNRADLIITIKPRSSRVPRRPRARATTRVVVEATSGAYNNFSTVIPASTLSTFVTNGAQFFDKRENRTAMVTDIDLAQLRANYVNIASLLGRKFRTIYVVDFRAPTTASLPAIRLLNGLTLPPGGLTLVTPNPLYVKGHYNAFSGHLGTTNTSLTQPAALVADAVTVLSGAWSDANASLSLASRLAADTTVNAAVMTGIVPTGNGYYSGGYENTLRLLEDWRSRTLTYNGSTVVLFPSRAATSPWGASPDVYDVPTRRFNFDANFLTESRLPASTPELRVMFRGEWSILASSVMP